MNHVLSENISLLHPQFIDLNQMIYAHSSLNKVRGETVNQPKSNRQIWEERKEKVVEM